MSKKVLLLLFGDLVALFAALFVALLVRYQGLLFDKELSEHFIAFSVIFFLWLVMLGSFGFYELRFARNRRIFLYRLLQVMAANAVLAIIVFYLFPFFTIEPRRNLLFIALLATIALFAWRSLFNMLVVRAGATRVLFLGTNPETAALAGYLLSHPQLGHRPAGFVVPLPKLPDVEGTEPVPVSQYPSVPLPKLPDVECMEPVGQSPVPPSTSNITSATASLPHRALDPANFSGTVRELKAETIVVSPEMKGDMAVLKALFGVIPLGVTTVDFAPFHEMLTGKIPLSLIGEAWFLENLIGMRKRSYDFAKRGIDVLLALAIGIPAAVLFPFIALAIVLEAPGPVFFRQQRVGRSGRGFMLLKYRSSYRTVAPATQTEGTKEETGVYTAVGKFLRASYIDEMPQIINILKGEMSFVGPRPERPEYVTELKERVPFYEIRLLAPPGLSGWAQINMEDDAAAEDAPEKMQYDLYYVKNRSFTLDLLIMIRTLFTLLRRQGR